MDRDERFFDDGTLSPGFMNSALAFIYAKHSADDFCRVWNVINPAQVKAVHGFFDRTHQWMKDNPLKPGQSYDTL